MYREKSITELKELGKPFIIILNTKNTNTEGVREVKEELINTYDVPVLPINVTEMDENEILNIFRHNFVKLYFYFQ